MLIKRRRFVFMRPDDGGEGGGAGGGAAGGAGANPGAAGAGDGGAPAGGAADPGGAAAGGAAAGAGGAAGTKQGDGAGAGGEGGAGAGATPAAWPANWRETVAGEDVAKLSQLQRYASPNAALNALFAAQARIRSGELLPVLGKNPSEQELSDWRAAHGIPATPDKYDLGKDVPIDETDKPMLDQLLKAAHESNQTPAQIAATIKGIKALQEQSVTARIEADKQQTLAGEETLRAEWGQEFRRNINLAHGLLDGAAGQTFKANFLDGRLADGTRIGSSPEALRMLVDLALIRNPTGVVVPGSDANPMQGVEDEITRIEKVMKTDRATYNKDEKMQARLRELYGAREQMKPRGREAA